MVFILEIAEKLLALAGGAALALPFLRDQRWRRILDGIKQARPSDPGAASAQEDAQRTVEMHNEQFKPEDWRDGLIGIGCLVASFAIGLVAVLAS